MNCIRDRNTNQILQRARIVPVWWLGIVKQKQTFTHLNIVQSIRAFEKRGFDVVEYPAEELRG